MQLLLFLLFLFFLYYSLPLNGGMRALHTYYFNQYNNINILIIIIHL